MVTTTFRGKQYPYLSMFSNTEQINKFFTKLKVNQKFIYSNGYSFEEVRSMAIRRGLIIEYDKMSGGELFAYVTTNKLTEKKVFHFDVAGLDI